jgi:hypothetical protein
MSEVNISFGTELLKKLNSGVSKKIIAKWAYGFYLDNSKNINKNFELDIMRIVAMEEGPEFDINTSELFALAEKYNNS